MQWCICTEGYMGKVLWQIISMMEGDGGVKYAGRDTSAG